jgi:AcrR family transcriptional regulator
VPSSPTSRLPAAQRRRQLLDVALEVFARDGFHDASMNAIAEAAGVTKPVLYQHFESKRALYRELLVEVGEQLQDEIAKAAAQAGSPHEQVRAGFAAYFHWVAERRDAFHVLFGGGTRRDAEFAEVASRAEASIAATIAEFIQVEGMAAADRELLAYGLVGMSEGTSRQWIATGATADPDHLATTVAELAWAGLRGSGPREL